jgi:hypothetical protein
MPRLLKYVLLTLIFWLLGSIPLTMQFETGSIEGLIRDERGAVEGASVEARNVMSGAIFHAESNVTGYYKLENIRAGRYSLWVEAVDHDSIWIPPVSVERGQSLQQHFRMTRNRPNPTEVSR